MKNLRAICYAAKWFDSDYFHKLFGFDYQSTAIYLNTFPPDQVRKLLDVIDLQREALEKIASEDMSRDKRHTAREVLVKSEELLK